MSLVLKIGEGGGLVGEDAKKRYDSEPSPEKKKIFVKH